MSDDLSEIASRNSDTFAARLAIAIGQEVPASFARRVDVKPGTFRKYLVEDAMPGADTALRISRGAGVSLEWLIDGTGPMRPARFDSPNETRHGEGTQPEQTGVPMLQITRPDELVEGAMVLVPRLDVSASAGAGSLTTSEDVHDFVAFAADYIRSLGINPQYAKMHSVKGDSMHPTLVDGEWVIIDTAIEHVVDEGLYTVVYGGALLIKRIRMLRDGGITLVSENKAAGYPDETIRKADLYDLRIAGRVRGHFRFT